MDIKLHSIEKGSGEPLVLLHGNGEDSSYFRAQITYFSKRYRVLAIDTRGHGASPRGQAPFRIRQFAQDLRAFLDEKDIARAQLLGFSDGGNIALCFALEYPERVDKLILNGANLYSSGVKAYYQLPIVLAYCLFFCLSKLNHKHLRTKELLGLMVLDPKLKPRALSGLKMPVLVIAGTRDMIRASHTRLIYRSFSNAQLCFIPGDHFIAAKQSAAFNAAVERFLNG